MNSKEIWIYILSEARMYDGSPQDMQKYIDRFDSKFCISEKQKDIEVRKNDFGLKLAEFKNDYPRETLKEFYNYWTECNPNGKKMRFEMEKVFDIKKRLARWAKNNKQKITREPENRVNKILRTNQELKDELGVSN